MSSREPVSAALADGRARAARRWLAAAAGDDPAQRLLGALRRALALEAERRRLFLWLPVAFSAGILLYFAADAEPSLWPSLTGAGLAAAAAFALGRHPRAMNMAIAVAMVMGGFATATWRTREVSAPVLARPMIAKLRGLVLSVDQRPAGPRMVLRVETFGSLTIAERPVQVRVSMKPGTSVKAGDFIEATARLLPPPTAARPGGYDFARDAFFDGLGAVGSLVGKVTVAAPPAPPDFWTALAIAVDVARNRLTDRIAQASGGQEGALAAALVTGKRGLITEDVNDALRAAGIYHIVSISGLHMALAAGSLFWAARAVLALIPGLALVWPVKKLAALVGMTGAIAYCLFSGAEVATQRSLVMTLVMMGAILIDRPALSMRNLALAALICLAIRPEALLGPSFQMSFAAVAGMIAFAVQPSGLFAGRPAGAGGLAPLHGIGRWAFLVIFTTAIATIATAPFSAYHFQTLNPLGLLGNALALPLIELAVMPLSVLGIFASAFALDQPVWWLIGQATAPVLAGAKMVALLDRSTVIVPALAPAALAFFSAAIVWSTLWTTALRWLAIVPAALGALSALAPSRPDVYVDRSGAGAAVREKSGQLIVLGRPSDFVLEQWLRADGDGRATDDPGLRGGALCDRFACVAKLPDGRSISLVRDKRAFPDDCRRAVVIVTPLVAPNSCASATVLDRRALDQSGATTLTATAEGFARVTASSTAQRPWTGTKPHRPASPAPAPPPRPRIDNLDPLDAIPSAAADIDDPSGATPTGDAPGGEGDSHTP
ncbi:ComEC/Rec2 family competence protein [Chelatococcus sp. GCM10030263]|uniref:ComEC/Rec2 family competence protein n=1 Tax=Chelatococcus sp. GCM10030263 TaxID=3273387 RepID=UPI0036194A54